MDVTTYKLAKTAELALGARGNDGGSSVIKALTVKEPAPELDFENDEEIQELIVMAEKAMQAEVLDKLKNNHLVNILYNQIRPVQKKFIRAYNVYPTKRPAPTVVCRGLYKPTHWKNQQDKYFYDRADTMLRDRRVQTIMVNLYGVDALIEIAELDGIILTEQELAPLQEIQYISDEEITEFDRKVGKAEALFSLRLIKNDPNASPTDKLRAIELEGKILGFVVNKTETKNTNINADFISLLEHLDKKDEERRTQVIEDMKPADIVEVGP